MSITLQGPGNAINSNTAKIHTASVSEAGQLAVQAENHSFQLYKSLTDASAYQAQGEVTLTGAGTHTVLHITNVSTTQVMAFTYIRLQPIGLTGGTALPNPTNYYEIGFDRDYVSGGSLVNPTNLNRSSANAALATVYDSAPVLTGTFQGIDRWRMIDGTTMVYNKEGSIILTINQSIEIRVVTDHTGGTLYARTSFVYI